MHASVYQNTCVLLVILALLFICVSVPKRAIVFLLIQALIVLVYYKIIVSIFDWAIIRWRLLLWIIKSVLKPCHSRVLLQHTAYQPAW